MAEIEKFHALRLRLHRLKPSRPIRTARGALAFIRERRVVVSTGRSSLPMLAEAIAGHLLYGSWMASPAVFRIYGILGSVRKSDAVVTVPLVLGKETLLDVALGPAVARIASDPARCQAARSHLPPLAIRLLKEVESRREVRMDQWSGPKERARKARALLERELLVVSRELHTEHGYHTVVLRPWRVSTLAARFSRASRRLTLGQAADQLILAAVRSAVIAPEHEVRRWFVFGSDRLDDLIAQRRVERVGSGRRTLILFRH